MSEDAIIKSVYWTPKVHLITDIQHNIFITTEILLGDWWSLSRVSLCGPGCLQEYRQSDRLGPARTGDIPRLLRHGPGQPILSLMGKSFNMTPGQSSGLPGGLGDPGPGEDAVSKHHRGPV